MPSFMLQLWCERREAVLPLPFCNFSPRARLIPDQAQDYITGPSSEGVTGRESCKSICTRLALSLIFLPGTYGSMMLPFVSDIPIPTRTPECIYMPIGLDPHGGEVRTQTQKQSRSRQGGGHRPRQQPNRKRGSPQGCWDSRYCPRDDCILIAHGGKRNGEPGSTPNVESRVCEPLPSPLTR